MTTNEELVASLSEYDKSIVADGLTKMLQRPIFAKDILRELNDLTDKWGGSALVAVLDYYRNI